MYICNAVIVHNSFLDFNINTHMYYILYIYDIIIVHKLVLVYICRTLHNSFLYIDLNINIYICMQVFT